MNKEELYSGGYFFAYQFTDDCLGSGMVSRGLYTQPVCGKIVQKNERASFLRTFCKKSAFAIAGQFWRIFCIVFIQSIVFFISQIRHGYLLCFEHCKSNISLGNAMFERRRNTFDVNFHLQIIPKIFRRHVNGQLMAGGYFYGLRNAHKENIA